jgi:broad specificity phosphatase PhoE
VLEIWLIRHGETDWNVDHRIQGVTDIPLNARGVAQAQRLAGRLAHVGFDAIFSSDSQRAHATAQHALPGAPIVTDPRLRELAYGVFEGERWESLPAALVPVAKRWRADRWGQRIPGGESFQDLTVRMQAFLAELPAAGRVALFSHGGAIRTVLYHLWGFEPNGQWRLEITNTGITRIVRRHQVATLWTLNDHAHLAGSEHL